MRRARLFLFVMATALASAASASLQSHAWADEVTDWNLIMQQTVSVAPTNAMEQSRWGAIAQLAVFEAVNSITKDYEPYLGTIEAPAGQTVELLTETTHDVPGERIAWRSVEGSQITTAGEVLFSDGAPGRGTIVQLVMTYDPPAGPAGKVVAKLFQREPAIQARRDLRRFKQLVETGEVTTNASPSARSSESPAEARI